jgi:hypothetical protein
LKEFFIFFEGNSGQKKEKIRKLSSSEMEALVESPVNKCWAHTQKGLIPLFKINR